MGWLIALGIVVLLAMLPLGAAVTYDKNGPLVRVIAGPVKFRVYPKKNKAGQEEKDQKKKEAKKAKKEAKKEAKKAAASGEMAPGDGAESTPDGTDSAPDGAENQAEGEEKGGSILDFWPFVELILDFLGDFRRKLRVNRLTLHLTMAADDPCDLAVNYGKANAAMAALLAQLERLFVIRRRDVRVNCDFTADDTTILARLDLTMTLGRILSLLVRYGIRALKTYLSIQKKRKGGANL